MTISLSGELERVIRSLVEGGKYASESDVIEAALRLLEQHDHRNREDRERIEALLIEGLDSGPATPMTSADWDEIEHNLPVQGGIEVIRVLHSARDIATILQDER